MSYCRKCGREVYYDVRTGLYRADHDESLSCPGSTRLHVPETEEDRDQEAGLSSFYRDRGDPQ